MTFLEPKSLKDRQGGKFDHALLSHYPPLKQQTKKCAGWETNKEKVCGEKEIWDPPLQKLSTTTHPTSPSSSHVLSAKKKRTNPCLLSKRLHINQVITYPNFYAIDDLVHGDIPDESMILYPVHDMRIFVFLCPYIKLLEMSRVD